MKLLFASIVSFLLIAPSALASAVGIQDDGMMNSNPAAVCDTGQALQARWQRIIIQPRDKDAAGKIRDAHKCGFSVILTIGGTGTQTPMVSASTLIKTINRLPRVERYTVINEPDLLNLPACRYRSIWMRVRHVVGRRLLWGDFSPFKPLTYTQAVVNRCGALPTNLSIAVHPYCNTDPLAACMNEGGIGNLPAGRMWLRKNAGLKVTWWVDEFAYVYQKLGETKITDEQAAAMWPRAIAAVARAGSPVLVIYTPNGPTWDSRPRELSWCVLTHTCAAPSVPLPTTDDPWTGQ